MVLASRVRRQIRLKQFAFLKGTACIQLLWLTLLQVLWCGRLTALPIYAGTEVAVASTKAFSAQVAALYWLAHKMALEKGLIQERGLKQAEDDLLVVAEILEAAIEFHKKEIVQKLAPYYAQFKHALFLCRQISYPFALEASLKLKEISYIFTDTYPAAELKHGPLALVDSQMPVFVFSVLDPVNLSEARI